ncbi:hypothetical protein AAHN93_10590 [Vandammella animalimorsus]|uniref:hypothetical protein n=1 Tax=Vandammella animalimorsus TaxID=2029117 RepID=UPI0031BAF594
MDAQIASIKRRMAEEGFNFTPTQCKSIDEVEEVIQGDVFQDQIDLILVDWDLGGHVHGQDVIERIRQFAPYKDIVFYSALTPAADLRTLAFEKGLEGIYCAARGDLVEEVIGVFESLVKKVLDIDHTRGIVMGATSDIDHMVHSCLLCIEAKRDDIGKKDLVDQAIKRVQERVQDITKQGQQLSAATDIATILEAHMIFTTNDRLRLLRRLLDSEGRYEGSIDKVKSYMNNVLPNRNMLGHMVLTPKGGSKALVDTEGKQISLEDMRTLRKTILDLREDFRALLDTLKA